MAEYTYPDDLRDLRRRFEETDRALARLHAEYATRPQDETYRARVDELRAEQRATARALSSHPHWATVGGSYVARAELQRQVAEEVAGGAET